MFVVIAILLGIIIGLIRKGSIKSLFTTPLKLWPLGLLGVIIQIGLHFAYSFGITSIYITIVNFVSYALILITLVFNIKHIWCIFTIIGTTLNFLVSFLNGGRIPVAQSVLSGLSGALVQSITNGTNYVYVLMDTSATKLWMLGHLVRIPAVGTVTSLYGAVSGISVGGILVFIGIIGWVQNRMTVNVQSPKKVSIFDDDDQDEVDYIMSEADKGTFKNYSVSDENGDTFIDVDTTSYRNDLSEFAEDISDDELTEVIPKLTPELIHEIRRKALLESDEFFEPDTSETKVFTAIRDLDRLDDVDEINDTKSIDDMNISYDDREDDFSDTSADLSYVDQTEKAAGSISDWRIQDEALLDVIEQTDNDIMIESNYINDDQLNVFDDDPAYVHGSWDGLSLTVDDNDNMLKEEVGHVVEFDIEEEQIPAKKPEWNPNEVERNSYAASPLKLKAQQSNPYSTLFNKSDDDIVAADQGRSTEQMRDIWHQFSMDNERKFKRQSKNHFDDAAYDESYAEIDTTVDDQLSESPVSEPDFEEAREKMARKWDENSPIINVMNLDRTSTERVDSREVLRRSLKEKKEQEKIQAISEFDNGRDGYEKIEVMIQGKPVSFWRKKKETE